jgi:hypothetical protein
VCPGREWCNLAAVNNVGNSFSLPFKDPSWFSTFLVIGLIALIPIAGWINLTGWMLATLDNYRQGRAQLPPAGFQYIGRGANVFIVGLIYGLALAVIIGVPFVLVLLATLGTSIQNGATGDYSSANPSLAFFPVWSGGILLVTIVEYLFLPAVVIQTERHGIAGGLNVAAIFNMAAANWKSSLLAAVLIYAAGFIGGLGIYACCVGILVSYPYAAAVVAGILRYYEAGFENPGPVPPPVAGPPPAAA